jgi:hypothetical protein
MIICMYRILVYRDVNLIFVIRYSFARAILSRPWTCLRSNPPFNGRRTSTHARPIDRLVPYAASATAHRSAATRSPGPVESAPPPPAPK